MSHRAERFHDEIPGRDPVEAYNPHAVRKPMENALAPRSEYSPDYEAWILDRAASGPSSYVSQDARRFS